MMKVARYGLFFLLIAFAACRGNKNKQSLPDMRHTYSKKSTKPFGTFVAYDMLNHKYGVDRVETVKKDFKKNYNNSLTYKKGLYVIIAKNVLLSTDDLELMMRYVENGNQVFISAEYISEELLDTLNIAAQYGSIFSVFANGSDNRMRMTNVSLSDSAQQGKAKYGYFYFPMNERFIKADSAGAAILGVNDSGAPDYISIIHGKGRFFLHLHPEAMSNYFLLTGNNKEYFEKVFSYTSTDRSAVYWDDYYRIGNIPDEEFSMFTVFLKYPMLKWALFVALAAILFYVAFGSKRRQRTVPLKPKYNNDSVSFVETIGRLYLQKKDNHNIADKMITFFMEHIRSHYYLNTSQLNSEFFSSLARKSGVAENQVKELFEQIIHLQQSDKISDEQLLNLNNRIQIFLKK